MAKEAPPLTEEQRRQLEEKLKNMPPEELKKLQQQQCIFCQIVAGKIPSKKIYEDDFCLAILDINPAAKGHLLLIPKEHYAIMPHLPDDLAGHMLIVSKYLSKALLKSLRVEGTNVFIANGPAAGQRAQHLVLHVIPRKDTDKILDLSEKFLDAEMLEKIKSAVQVKLNEILGVKEIATGAEAKEAEKFVTSAKAKRYHAEKCPFAQNIPKEEKIVFSKEEAIASGKRPCSCVTGVRIPLKKEAKEEAKAIVAEDSDKKEPAEEKSQETKPGKKAKKNSGLAGGKKASKKEEEENGAEPEEETESPKDVSLDDIAKLFK